MEYFGRPDAAFQLNLPYILLIIVSQAKSGLEFFDAAIDIRESSEASELRDVLREIEGKLELGASKTLGKIRKEISDIGEALIARSGIARRYLRLTPPLEWAGIKLDGEELSAKLKIPEILYKQVFLGRRYRVFLRDTMKEIASVGQLGTLKDTLNGFAWVDGTQYPATYAKSPRFGIFERRFNSHTPPPKY